VKQRVAPPADLPVFKVEFVDKDGVPRKPWQLKPDKRPRRKTEVVDKKSQIGS
jgi:hypothetical protein